MLRSSTATACALRTLRFRSVKKMSSSAAPLLVTPREVNELAQSKRTAILDATWLMPNSARNAKEEFLTKRIPSSQFLDLDEVASPNEHGLKHMMPTSQIFANACETFGISPSSHVIIYDTHGIFSSPRALFMFRTFGHTNSSVLDGGLPRWIDEGYAIGRELPDKPQSSSYIPPKLHQEAIRSYKQMTANASQSPATAELVLDARSKARFSGEQPEPRPGLSSGHMPNSYSLPFGEFLQKHKSKDGQEYTSFLPPADIRQALESAIGSADTENVLHRRRSVISSCGSGMTAGVLWLGLQLIGAPPASLYDESWSGYALRPTSIILGSQGNTNNLN